MGRSGVSRSKLIEHQGRLICDHITYCCMATPILGERGWFCSRCKKDVDPDRGGIGGTALVGTGGHYSRLSAWTPEDD